LALVHPEILVGAKDIFPRGAGAKTHRAFTWNAAWAFLDYAPIFWDYSIIGRKSEMFAEQRALNLELDPGLGCCPMPGKFQW
jgi:hypothetical protein